MPRNRLGRFEMSALTYTLFFLSLGSAALAQQQAVPSEWVQTAVNVRAAPTTDSAVPGKLEPGESLQVQGDVPGWHRVQLKNGLTGYVSKAWTVVADVSAAGVVRLHAIDFGTGLNLR